MIFLFHSNKLRVRMIVTAGSQDNCIGESQMKAIHDYTSPQFKIISTIYLRGMCRIVTGFVNVKHLACFAIHHAHIRQYCAR